MPHHLRKSSTKFDPTADSIKVMTMHASKGLEFPVVALMGVGRMPEAGADEREEARLFYVGATRATQRLVIVVSGDGGFGSCLTTTKTGADDIARDVMPSKW
jgi:superfamily I DNA/RNA helicase